MAFVGNRRGPRESAIVRDLGASYFGISLETLEGDIQEYEYQEEQGLITPVRQDDAGRYFIVFSGPQSARQVFYLDEHGLNLTGDVRIWAAGASIVELKP